MSYTGVKTPKVGLPERRETGRRLAEAEARERVPRRSEAGRAQLLRPPPRSPCSPSSTFSRDELGTAMTRVSPPWIIEEADRRRRRREEGARPRLEIPPPPPLPVRSGEEEPEARVIVIDLLLQG